MQPKPIDTGFVTTRALAGQQGRVDLEEDVMEGGTEICAIDGCVSGGFGVVQVLATGAVEFDCFDGDEVRETHGGGR